MELTDTGPLCPVNLYRCLQVSASQIMISLFMSPVALKKCNNTAVIYLQLTEASKGDNPHQIFSIWGYGHTQDVSCVSNMAFFCSFPSSVYRVQLPATFNVPWTQRNQSSERFANNCSNEIKTTIVCWLLTFNDWAVFGSREDAFVIRWDDKTGKWKFVSLEHPDLRSIGWDELKDRKTIK